MHDVLRPHRSTLNIDSEPLSVTAREDLPAITGAVLSERNMRHFCAILYGMCLKRRNAEPVWRKRKVGLGIERSWVRNSLRPNWDFPWAMKLIGIAE